MTNSEKSGLASPDDNSSPIERSDVIRRGRNPREEEFRRQLNEKIALQVQQNKERAKEQTDSEAERPDSKADTA